MELQGRDFLLTGEWRSHRQGKGCQPSHSSTSTPAGPMPSGIIRLPAAQPCGTTLPARQHTPRGPVAAVAPSASSLPSAAASVRLLGTRPDCR